MSTQHGENPTENRVGNGNQSQQEGSPPKQSGDNCPADWPDRDFVKDKDTASWVLSDT